MNPAVRRSGNDLAAQPMQLGNPRPKPYIDAPLVENPGQGRLAERHGFVGIWALSRSTSRIRCQWVPRQTSPPHAAHSK